MNLLAFFTLAAACMQRAMDPTPQPREQVIIDVRIGSSSTVASATMLALRSGDTLLLPVAQVLALAEFGSHPFEEEYASTDRIAAVLRVRIRVNWDDLVAAIEDDGTLPVSRRARRGELRRALADAAQESMIATAIAPPWDLLPRTLGVDYDIRMRAPNSFTVPGISLGLSANMLYGSMTLDATRTSAVNRNAVQLSWERTLPPMSPLRHLRIGATLLRRGSISVSGVMLSTESPYSATATQPIAITGAAAAGSDFEIWRNGAVVFAGVADSTGQFEATIPSAAGVNDLAITSFTRSGEESDEHRYVVLDQRSLPAGVGSYTLRVGRCAEPRCDYATEVATRFGIMPRLTLGVDVDATTGKSAPIIDPRWSLVAHLRDDVNASFSSGWNETAVDARFLPSRRFDLAATYRATRSDSAFGVLSPHGSSASAAASWYTGPNYFFSASLESAVVGRSRVRRLHLSSSLLSGPLYFRAFSNFAQYADAALPVEYGFYGETALPLHAFAARVRAGATSSRPRSAFANIVLSPLPTVQLDAGVAWTAGRGALLGLSVSAIGRAMRYESRSVSGNASESARAELSGSVRVTTLRRRPAFSSTPARGRGEIAGRVFVDANCDGRWQRSEQPLDGVSLRLGPSVVVETDSLGEFRLDDVTPSAEFVVTVDSTSLPSPYLVAIPQRISPLGNGTTHVDVPVTARDSSGRPVCSDPSVGGLAKHPERGYSSAVHGDNLKTQLWNPDPVTNAWEMSEPREDVTAERRPVAVWNRQVVIRAGVDE